MKRKQKAAPSGGSRAVRVGEQLRQEMMAMLQEGLIKDPRLDGLMITLTEVRVTSDLMQATVFASVFTEEQKVADAVIAGLGAASREFKREIAARLKLRFVPELRFLLDTSIRYGANIERLLKEIADERED